MRIIYLYLQADKLHKKEGQKGQGRSKKAENSHAHPLAQAKKENLQLKHIKKLKLMKYYFEISIIKNFFTMKKINIYSPNFKKFKFEKNVISCIPSSTQILN